MPEGHTTHRLAKDLFSTLVDQQVEASSPQGHFAVSAEQIDGTQLVEASAWGKHLFCEFEGPTTLHIHLGLIGKLRRKEVDEPVVGQIRLRLVGERDIWDLSGPMVCELIEDTAPIVAKLGPDPLRPDGDPDLFVERLRKRSIPLCAAILDQKVIAGLGNVFRSELCFLLGVDPRTPAKNLDEDTARALWGLAVAQLELGVERNRIVTRDLSEVDEPHDELDDDARLYVYKRDGSPCHRCGDEIVLIELAKRKAWYCPTCQS